MPLRAFATYTFSRALVIFSRLGGGVFVKVYRTQIEPEFIYVSSAGVPPVTDANYDRILEVKGLL